ncbi:MAG: M23 family metallopeptidase [Ruminococcaceae bacterium]|nr:M23 family metallopeptidase [Oscillospiraceae bacterium]
MKKGKLLKTVFLTAILAAMLLVTGCSVDENAQIFSDFDALFAYLQGNIPLLPGEGEDKWGMPCRYTYVSSRFGSREDPVYGGSDYHRGIDLAAPKWTTIHAVRAGEVTYAGWDNGGGGNYVSIEHGDGYKTQYLHMEAIAVKEGQLVKKGQIIGYVGSTGNSTGNHLHFAVRKWNEKNGVWDYIDPEQFITFN